MGIARPINHYKLLTLDGRDDDEDEALVWVDEIDNSDSEEEKEWVSDEVIQSFMDKRNELSDDEVDEFLNSLPDEQADELEAMIMTDMWVELGINNKLKYLGASFLKLELEGQDTRTMRR